MVTKEHFFWHLSCLHFASPNSTVETFCWLSTTVYTVHVNVLRTLPLYRMPWVYRCTVRQSSGVSFNHFISSLLLDTKCQEESLRADNSLPCLRVITTFTTQSNLPDLSFFCPTLITSLQGFYDHFLSYSSPLCFAGNSNEFKYLQAVVSRSRTNILYFAWIMLWEKVRK